MISVGQAERIIKRAMPRFGNVTRPIKECYGLVLQENLYADRDFPAFDKVLMDGIAISYASLKSNTSFAIENIQAAGKKVTKLKNKNACIEVMTGCVLPTGCDTVIPIEQTSLKNQKASIKNKSKIVRGQFILKKGSEKKKGVLLTEKGQILTSSRIAIAASIGKDKLKVSHKPKVAIISTGDELVNLAASIKPYQIRKSNSYFLDSALKSTQLFDTAMFHIKDNEKLLMKSIKSIIKNHDCLVLSGGVSMGKFDYVPKVLKSLGAKLLFHKVKQRPGKPLWFGTVYKKPIFALPGNPVSTQVGTFRYVIPYLKLALGIKDDALYAKLSKDYQSNTNFTVLLPVSLRINKSQERIAKPINIKGSSDMISLSEADGIIELPANSRNVKAGFIGKVYKWN